MLHRRDIPMKGGRLSCILGKLFLEANPQGWGKDLRLAFAAAKKATAGSTAIRRNEVCALFVGPWITVLVNAGTGTSLTPNSKGPPDLRGTKNQPRRASLALV